MAVYFYDQALVDRTRKVLKDQDVHIITNEKMFTKSKDKLDNPIFPAVSYTRDGYSLTTVGKNFSLYRRGRLENDGTGKLYQTKSLPIEINYQCDVWTRTRESNDELTRELLWFFTYYPEHTIHLSYDGFERNTKFHVFLGDEIVDNSAINEFEDIGQYYRSSFTLRIDEAQLFLVNSSDYTKIKYTLSSYTAENEVFDTYESEIFNISEEP